MNITGLSSKPKKAFGVSGSPMGIRDRRVKSRRIGASDEHFGARDAEVLAALYPSPLSFYDSVPGCDLSLADFEALAVERLKLLRIMEKHSQVEKTCLLILNFNFQRRPPNDRAYFVHCR